MNNTLGLWIAVLGTLALGCLTLALVLYQTRREPAPAAKLRDMTQKIVEQRALIVALQQQAAEQWVRIIDQEQQLRALREERAELERRLQEAERQTGQLQAIVDQLLPGAGNDRALIGAIRETLAAAERRLAEANAQNAALRVAAGGGA